LGAREHYAVPRSIHRHRALALLVTDAWVRPGNILGRLKPGLRARFHRDLETARVRARNGASIAFELRTRRAGIDGWQRIIARNRWFQKTAVEALSRVGSSGSAPIVMAYSYAARDILAAARARGWRTVLAQIDPGPSEERLVAGLHEGSRQYQTGWRPAPMEYWSAWREECALADRIVVNSAWTEGALRDEGVPAAKIRIIPLGYDASPRQTPRVRNYPGEFTPSRPMRALFLGQINLRKGVGPLLEAIRMLRGQPVEFTFVGDIQIPIPPDLRALPQVRWAGAIPREETWRFYQDADLFLFPTLSDGFGLTQLEAQAWGLPIITSKFCGEVVEDDKDGVVLAEVTPSVIADAIRRCCADPGKLRSMAGRIAPAARFDLDRVGQQWLEAFD
jgi:glycosyltransferase involved in cell wall biosynthesis